MPLETGHDGERPEGDIRHVAWGTGRDRTARADMCTRERLSREDSTCPPHRGVSALHLVFLLQLSPKWGMNPDNSESDRHWQLIENHDQTPFPRGNLRMCERRKYRDSCKHKTMRSSLFTAQTCNFWH